MMNMMMTLTNNNK